MMRRAVLLLVALASGCPGPRAPSTPPPAQPAGRVPIDWAASDIDWNRPPAPAPEPKYRVPAPVSLTLGNGLTVVVIENHRLPLVSMTAIIPNAGGVWDPPDRKGLAALTADLLDEGAGRWSTLELADRLERLGAELDTGAAADAALVWVDTMTSTLEPTLELLAAVLARPTLSAADFDRIKADQLEVIRRRRDRPRSVAALLFDRVLFGAHAYGLPNSGLEPTVERIDHHAVTRFYADHYAPEATTLVIAGDVDAGSVTGPLERTLGQWPRHTLPPASANFDLPPNPPPRLVVCDRPGSEQTVVWIGRVAMTRSDPRYPAATVINTVLGGGFTSRLNNRLREQLGYTYGASSSFWFARYAGTWSFRSSIKTADTIAGIREALRLIEQVRVTDVPADELDRGRKLITRQLPQAFQTNGAIAATFADLVVERLPLDFYDGFTAAIDAVTAARARHYAEANFARADLTLVAVGDLHTILDGLLGLGFGDALEVDPEGNPVRSHPVPK